MGLHELLRNCRDLGLRQQIADPADSILANLAEGAERNPRPEFRQFPGCAKGAAGETRSRLHIGKRLGCLPADMADQLPDELRRIPRMIPALIQSLDR